ncbi:MAG: AMP-binding protein [Gammaproteobacteria bacterium]|nr:AMP-binding protein [Gammaproteobacteria bacterium]MCP5202088.1 AMP-binding protein [Gammaproteobacteria bacterium]
MLFRVRVVGLEHAHAAGDNVLVVANHVSWLDGLFLYLFLPVVPAFAVNGDTARRRWLRPFLGLVEWYELDLLNPVSIKALVRPLREGRPLVMFPEGRPSTTGIMMKVYDGPGLVVDKAGARVLPVGIEGLQYSRAGLLGHRLRLRWLPQVTLTVLPARTLDVAAGLRGAARRAAATAWFAALMRDVAYANSFHDETLFEAVVRAARRHGRGHVVLEDAGGARLGFGQLLTRCFVLGSVIARLTARDERVGIMLPSTAAAVVTLFACQARGRQAAMLNFTAGARGLVTAVETANIKAVFTARAFVETAGLEEEIAALAGHVEVIYLEDLRERIGIVTKLVALVASHAPLLAHRLLAVPRQPRDPAVVLFTSGSEGIPKGVVLSHANLLANFAQVSMLIDLTHEDRVLNVLPVFHAFGLLGGVLLPMLKGTPTYQYPNPLHYRLVPELCYQLGVSCLFGTTTFLRGYARNAHCYDFHRLRYVIAGAEKLTDDVRQAWAERFGIRIFEGYGATEASPVLAVNYPLAHRAGTVGQLVAGMEHYLAPVAGIRNGGELVVRGPNVMLGYLFHGSDGTIIQPWTEARGAGWYATGDIVDVDGDGFVSIRGRARRFAKIGGEMVSLASVEELAQRVWPDGRHAALAMADSRKGEQILLVTDVDDAERSALVDAARAASISEITIPRRVLVMANLPLLGSGKVDYANLRDLVG